VKSGTIYPITDSSSKRYDGQAESEKKERIGEGVTGDIQGLGVHIFKTVSDRLVNEG